MIITGSADDIAEILCGPRQPVNCNSWSFDAVGFARDAAAISAAFKPKARRKLTDDEHDDNLYSIENGDGEVY